MGKKDILTEGEQKEIRDYIRNKAHNLPQNLSSLPQWLFELEIISYKWNRLPKIIKRIFDR